MKTKRRSDETVEVNTIGSRFRPSPSERIKQLERQIERAEERSEIERTANTVAMLVEIIQAKRVHIKNLKTELESTETQLNTSLLEHGLAIAKFKELGAIPQPTA